MPHRDVPFHLVGIDHVVFLVDDMDKALSFYQGVIGCARGFSFPDLGMEQVWAGAALIVLWDVNHPGAASAEPRGGANVDHVCIACGPIDPDELYAHLEKHDVTVERDAFHGGSRGEGRSYYIRDPFGNKLELKGPPEYADGT